MAEARFGRQPQQPLRDKPVEALAEPNPQQPGQRQSDLAQHDGDGHRKNRCINNALKGAVHPRMRRSLQAGPSRIFYRHKVNATRQTCFLA